jgi:hypothetical protein
MQDDVTTSNHYYMCRYEGDLEDFNSYGISISDGLGVFKGNNNNNIRGNLCDIELIGIRINFKYNSFEKNKIKDKIKRKGLQYLYEEEVSLFCVIDSNYAIRFYNKNKGILFIKNETFRENATHILEYLIS